MVPHWGSTLFNTPSLPYYQSFFAPYNTTPGHAHSFHGSNSGKEELNTERYHGTDFSKPKDWMTLRMNVGQVQRWRLYQYLWWQGATRRQGDFILKEKLTGNTNRKILMEDFWHCIHLTNFSKGNHVQLWRVKGRGEGVRWGMTDCRSVSYCTSTSGILSDWIQFFPKEGLNIIFNKGTTKTCVAIFNMKQSYNATAVLWEICPNIYMCKTFLKHEARDSWKEVFQKKICFNGMNTAQTENLLHLTNNTNKLWQ